MVRFTQEQYTTKEGRSLVGTPSYMSPDQVLGRPYDARSEIYSLGAVLFEMLVGHPPFLGETVLGTLSMHVHQKPDRVSDHVEVPADVELIVEKCLEKDPADRFQTIEELIKELKAGSVSTPENPAVKTLSSPKNRMVAPVVSLAVIAAGTICGGLLMQSGWTGKSSYEYRMEASTARKRGDSNVAKVLYEKALDGAKKDGQTIDQIEILNDMALLHLMGGDVLEATQYVQRAIDICEKKKNTSGVSTQSFSLLMRKLTNTLLSLANSLRDQKSYENAERLYKEALSKNSEDVEDYNQRPQILTAYSSMLLRMGRVQEANTLEKERDSLLG
ncbi:MAG: tetratricopeptide repeat protein, partial [Cyanobacteria bacterium]|nr:tetratricopeptide repeat protein [Cyanobacteriota bacterium]